MAQPASNAELAINSVELANTAIDSETQHMERSQETRALLPDQASAEQPSESRGRQEDELQSAPNVGVWRWHALTALILLVLAAFGVAVTALIFDVKGWSAGRKITFLVVGDWGRNGDFNQSLVAATMARHAKQSKPLFIISTGDNFYESGITSAQDEQFKTSFTDIYSDSSLQVPWWAVLGNHDYGEWWNVSSVPAPTNCNGVDPSFCYYSPLHQLNTTLTQRDWRWHCERWYERSLGQGVIDIFFIDTNPGVQAYHAEVWASNREDDICSTIKGGILEQSWESQVLELDARLGASTAQWKLVVGHHPVRSNHYPAPPGVPQALQPLLERHGVQAYFCGHEHMLQHLHESGMATHYIVSGGGSLTDYDVHFEDSTASHLQYPGSGFVSCTIDLKALECDFYGIKSDDAFYRVKILIKEPGSV